MLYPQCGCDFSSVWRLARTTVVTSAWRDRELLCQILKTTSSRQVSFLYFANTFVKWNESLPWCFSFLQFKYIPLPLKILTKLEHYDYLLMKTVFVGVNICKLHVWSSLCIFPLYVSEINDGQKRRRLEAPGVENQSPKPSNSGRIAELGIKADTPIVPSIFSRVQQLTQRREGRKHLNNGSKQTFEGFSFCVFTFYQVFLGCS